MYEQQDVDEFFTNLMDKLEEQLKKNSPQTNFVQKHFQGVITNEIICKTCPHRSEREEPFLVVSL